MFGGIAVRRDTDRHRTFEAIIGTLYLLAGLLLQTACSPSGYADPFVFTALGGTGLNSPYLATIVGGPHSPRLFLVNTETLASFYIDLPDRYVVSEVSPAPGEPGRFIASGFRADGGAIFVVDGTDQTVRKIFDRKERLYIPFLLSGLACGMFPIVRSAKGLYEFKVVCDAEDGGITGPIFGHYTYASERQFIVVEQSTERSAFEWVVWAISSQDGELNVSKFDTDRSDKPFGILADGDIYLYYQRDGQVMKVEPERLAPAVSDMSAKLKSVSLGFNGKILDIDGDAVLTIDADSSKQQALEIVRWTPGGKRRLFGIDLVNGVVIR